MDNHRACRLAHPCAERRERGRGCNDERGTPAVIWKIYCVAVPPALNKSYSPSLGKLHPCLRSPYRINLNESDNLVLFYIFFVFHYLSCFIVKLSVNCLCGFFREYVIVTIVLFDFVKSVCVANLFRQLGYNLDIIALH